MRVCPSFTCKATGSLIKKFSPKIASFKPIYAEQIENKQAIKQMKKERKKTVYKKLEQVPQGAFKDDDLTNI